MQDFPKIETERLILSELKESDLPLVIKYMQDKEYSDFTSTIPYPYGKEEAEFWLKITKEAFEKRKGYTFAIRDKSEKIIGAIGLHDEGADKAEMGYWMAKEFWNQGYVTEAAKAIVDFGFKELEFNKILLHIFLIIQLPEKLCRKLEWSWRLF